ncbi:capsule biosynthesis protein [Sedimentitalea todarodis]|uniref:capsule biosynthesis protein n=1 Tax=Sedimentitalea todarodis TaxID=1631240 RepID=UPI00292F68D5|nr:capsule biosynthesis protein CapA [Sedimentitalea todarodis]
MFLFLQGPHGPFFNALGRMLRNTGARVLRVGFNAGDRAFWFDRPSYIPFRGTPEDWPETVDGLFDLHGVTDIVLYGDTRSVHATAIAAARVRNITVHVFEEGYMRPYWVTYERGGANGNSRLMDMAVSEMQAQLERADIEAPPPPAHWGDMRQHMFYGAAYHWCVMFTNRGYRHFRPHRTVPVTREFLLHLKRLLLIPAHAAERRLRTARIRRGGYPYHLALLQLEHDASFQDHSCFDSTAEFLAQVIAGFAEGAPPHHHLVFKAHPLEDGRTPVPQDIARIAKEHGLCNRVHFVRGGKLARLMDDARSVVTVNSTAGQQALWRGLPLRIFGRAVYDKPEFISDQPLPAFFANPRRPDTSSYLIFRRYLLETSQVPGGFYSARSRQRLLRRVVDMILDPRDPYSAREFGPEAQKPQLRAIT